MNESAPNYAVLLLILGVVTLASAVVRVELRRLHLPAMAGYILIGVALSASDTLTGFMTEGLRQNLDFLAKIGVVILLFRVGLESDLSLLARQLRNAATIWLPNMVLPAVAAFLLVYFWPGYGLLNALFVAVAASATSIGVSTAVWEEAGQLKTPTGALLVDAAELDDISAVILLSVLFALVPVLRDAVDGSLWITALSAGGLQFGKLVIFCAGCYFFSRWLEKTVTAWFAEFDKRLGPLLFAVGATFLIAAAADILGFSMAIGALFAGLAFSRDPAEQDIDRSFAGLFAVFAPYFFVAIGLAIDITTVGTALWMTLALLAVVVLGKLIGAGIPAALLTSRRDGLLISVSMVPRAEIYLIVLLHGVNLGAWAIPKELYTAGVIVSLLTCIGSPVVVQRLLASKADVAEERTGEAG